MAILFVEGFEHGTTSSLLTGWALGPPAVNNSVRAGDGAYGQYSGLFSQTSGYRYAPFRRNVSAGRPVRSRLVHLHFQFRVPDTRRSNPLVVGDTAGLNISGGFRTDAGQFVACRGTTSLAAVAYSNFALDTFYPFKVSVFVDNSAGFVEVRRGEETTPVVSATNADTQGGANNYADVWGVLGQTFQPLLYLDDVVVYAPSILLDVGGGAIAAGDTLTLNGTSTVVVSDVDTSPDAPNVAVSGSLVRVWVHTWNGTTFADGDTAAGGTLASTTVVAPSARHRGGFEPWSWPEYEPVVGRYVVRTAWGANGTVALTPSAGTNYENVGNIPLATATYNEALSGSNEADTYTTPSALPAGVQSIEGIQVRVSGQSFGTYTHIEATLTDASGAQTETRTLSSVAELQVLQICELDAAGAAWSGLPTSGTYELTV